MELDELEERLVPFARTKYGDPFARVSDVYKMPGHAGFSYGFTVHSGGGSESWFLRLPPPNVQWKGTADVLRQVVRGEMARADAVKRMPRLKRVGGTCPCSKSVRWVMEETGGAETTVMSRPA